MAIYQKAVEVLGIENQLLKTVEELAELQRAMVRFMANGGLEDEYDNLIEEIADAKIMIRQLEVILHKSDKDYNEKIEEKEIEKLLRLENIILMEEANDI